MWLGLYEMRRVHTSYQVVAPTRDSLTGPLSPCPTIATRVATRSVRVATILHDIEAEFWRNATRSVRVATICNDIEA